MRGQVAQRPRRARIAGLAVVRQHHARARPRRPAAAPRRRGAGPPGTQVGQLGTARRAARTACCQSASTPSDKPGGLDRSRSRRARGRTGRRPPPRQPVVRTQLGAQQAQLRAQVALGGHLATEVDQGAQATVLVAQRGEAVDRSRQQVDGVSAGLYGGRTVRTRVSALHADPSERTGPEVCGRTVCPGLRTPEFEVKLGDGACRRRSCWRDEQTTVLVAVESDAGARGAGGHAGGARTGSASSPRSTPPTHAVEAAREPAPQPGPDRAGALGLWRLVGDPADSVRAPGGRGRGARPARRRRAGAAGRRADATSRWAPRRAICSARSRRRWRCGRRRSGAARQNMICWPTPTPCWTEPALVDL